MKHLVILAMFCAVSGTAIAQTAPAVSNDLTVTIAPGKYRICNDRPDRPVWMDELHPREAYKALTLMRLFELRSWEAVVASQDCDCHIRFPGWEAAELEFNERYAAISQAEHTNVQLAFREEQNRLASTVEAICREQGNW